MFFDDLVKINQKRNEPKKIDNYEIMSFPSKKINFGNYTGTYPKQAAQKAFTFLSSLMYEDIKKNGNFIVFSIRKKNRNNQKNINKTHKFIGTVVELENYVINTNTNKKVKLKNVVAKYNPEMDKIKATNKKIRYNNH